MEIHYLTIQVVDTPRTSQEIRLARMKHNLKQEEVAKAISVSRSYITQIENGLREISVPTAQKLKQFFDRLDQTS